MDMISYGAASKVAKGEKNIENILGQGISGTFPHTHARLDALEASLGKTVENANRAIVDDTINIMKANAKLNVVAKSLKYKHQNMIFDDLLDASGVDTTLSKHLQLDTTNGLAKYKPAVGWNYKYDGDVVPTSAGWVNDSLGAPSTTTVNNGILNMTSSSLKGYQYNHTLTGNPMRMRVKAKVNQGEIMLAFATGSWATYLSILSDHVEITTGGALNQKFIANNDGSIYHTYEFIYDSNVITFYIDGVSFGEISKFSSSSKYMTLRVNGNADFDFAYLANSYDAEDDTVFNLITTQEACTAAPSKAVLVVEEVSPSAYSSDVIPTMTSATTNGVTISSADVSGVSGNDLWKMCDDNSATMFSSAQSNGITSGNIIFDFGSGATKTVTQYTITAGGTVTAPNNWTLYGSNNNSTWTSLHTGSGQNWSIGEKRTYQLTNTTGYRYYKLFINGVNGGNGISIKEFELMESIPGGPVNPPQGSYFISRDDGTHWESISPEQLFQFSSVSPLDTKLRLKCSIPKDLTFNSYGLTWA